MTEDMRKKKNHEERREEGEKEEEKEGVRKNKEREKAHNYFLNAEKTDENVPFCE